jgi:hypothetical protein
MKFSPPKENQRSEILQRQQRLKMARSAQAYVRGSTVKFYEWLETAEGKVPEGSPIWICGDCHLGNLQGRKGFHDSSNDNREDEEEAEPVAGGPRPDCRGGPAALGRTERGREVVVSSRKGKNSAPWHISGDLGAEVGRKLVVLDRLALLVTAVFSDCYPGVTERSRSLRASSGVGTAIGVIFSGPAASAGWY